MATIEGLKGTRYEVGILLGAHMERANAAVGKCGSDSSQLEGSLNSRKRRDEGEEETLVCRLGKDFKLCTCTVPFCRLCRLCSLLFHPPSHLQWGVPMCQATLLNRL